MPNSQRLMAHQETRPNHDYNDYDYASFWEGREYEDAADKLAVERLLEKTFGPHRRIVDIGCGGGRITPLYFSMFEESVLVDPSHAQLEIAKQKFADLPRVTFLLGTAERVSVPSQSADVVLCVRVFHYIEKPRKAFAEIKRILRPGGYFILEIPNKVHAKARLRNLIRGKDRKEYRNKSAINISSKGGEIFLNHNPKTIAKDLAEEGFSVLETLSVSNLRSFGLKRRLHFRILFSLEKTLQTLFSRLRFGPSIYFLAKLERQKTSL